MCKIAVIAVLCIVCMTTPGRAQSQGQPEVRPNIAYGPDPAQHLDRDELHKIVLELAEDLAGDTGAA